MASMLPESAKVALASVQTSIITFFGIVLVFALIGNFITEKLPVKSSSEKKIIHGIFVGIGFIVAANIVY